MSENKRENHPEFTKYQEFIVNHPNYAGLFYKRNKNNSIRWVVTRKSPDGQKREAWWFEKGRQFGIEIKAGDLAKVAVLIHPTKKHTCQICGKSLRIEYVYPNARLRNKLKQNFHLEVQKYDKDIFEIINEIPENPTNLGLLKEMFKISENTTIKSFQSLKSWLQKEHVEKSSKSFLSPGVKSNAPDRFDGFHSDSNCCREDSDIGRHKSNMQRYGQDRRVYENWADGDWKQADRLMSEFRKFGLSADHIGPISLGFCHRPKFHALTKEENSAKNNRMSFSDVKVLIADEKKGEQVVSWHSKYLWDNLKNRVQNDADAVRLSALMRTNLHYVLTLFSIVDEFGFREFLMQFLNLKYSFFDYKFEGFNPENGSFEKVTKTEKRGKNQDNNTERYIRIAFETLEEYKEKKNRKVGDWKNPKIDERVGIILRLLNDNKLIYAKIELHRILKLLAQQLTQDWEKA